VVHMMLVIVTVVAVLLVVYATGPVIPTPVARWWRRRHLDAGTPTGAPTGTPRVDAPPPSGPRTGRVLPRSARSHPSMYGRGEVPPGVVPPGVVPPDLDDALAAHRASTERGLVTALLAGYLPSADYQRSMAALAARDADREPMVVPDVDA